MCTVGGTIKLPTSFYHHLQVLLVLTSCIYAGCYKFMASMAKATYDQSGKLLDGGIDLNMGDGMAEYVAQCLFVIIQQFKYKTKNISIFILPLSVS